jgi:hypothetical protein
MGPFSVGGDTAVPMAVAITTRVLADEIPVPLKADLSLKITTRPLAYSEERKDE